MNSRIRNYKRMDNRRVSFTLGVTCQTSYEKLVEIPRIVQEIIEAQPQTSFDRYYSGFPYASFRASVASRGISALGPRLPLQAEIPRLPSVAALLSVARNDGG